jgi:hypothetical protein
MLIKAKDTKKGRVAFLSHDATDKEIAAFVEFLNAGDRGPKEAKLPEKTKVASIGRMKAKTKNRAGKKKP